MIVLEFRLDAKELLFASQKRIHNGRIKVDATSVDDFTASDFVSERGLVRSTRGEGVVDVRHAHDASAKWDFVTL